MKKLTLPDVERKAQRFLACETVEDLRHIGFDANQIQLHALNPSYYTFQMRKRKGGYRTIEAPEYDLKEVQRQFNGPLQCVYYLCQSPAAFGYIIRVKGKQYKKNILENAKQHLGARFMLNVDFEDFFHQISGDRIFRLLQAPPFQFHCKTAHLLGRIFTYKKRLPMGAPTSPVLSNLACLELDNQLHQWAAENQLVYTRFVDDLTFSSPEKPVSSSHLEAITALCSSHQMKLNPAKTRFGENDVKKVTGLVVAETIDIEPEFYQELDRDLNRLRHTAEVNIILNKHNRDPVLREFKQEVEGQVNFIGMIEGYDSPIFYQYRQRLKSALTPDDEALSVRWTNFNYL